MSQLRAHPTLRLVNEDVALRPQVLRPVNTPAPRPFTEPREAAARILRLTAANVGVEPVPEFVEVRRREASVSDEGQVRREMLSASTLSPDDARSILARRTGELLEGGRQAMLRPERRRNLERLASRLGLRDFDAGLVIAIAQDAARHGERSDAGSVDERLALVGGAGRSTPGDAPAAGTHARIGWTVLASAVLASLMLAALIRWISA